MPVFSLFRNYRKEYSRFVGNVLCVMGSAVAAHPCVTGFHDFFFAAVLDQQLAFQQPAEFRIRHMGMGTNGAARLQCQLRTHLEFDAGILRRNQDLTDYLPVTAPQMLNTIGFLVLCSI